MGDWANASKAMRAPDCERFRMKALPQQYPTVAKKKRPISILHVALLNGPSLMFSTDKQSAVALYNASCHGFVIHKACLFFASFCSSPV